MAVKVPAAVFVQTNVERFRREAQSAAGLSHPHIVAVYDWGEEDDTSFIVMEYVPGQTLREMIESFGRLSPMDASRLTAEIADAFVVRARARRVGAPRREAGQRVVAPRSGEGHRLRHRPRRWR